MSETTGIEWTDATWNPWHGCHKVSPGCKDCYMFREKKQYGQNPNLVVRSKTKFREPLKWAEARKIFTCSWSDWFIEEADAWRDEAWAIIRQTPQHTYQILTKRIERAHGRVPVPALPNVWIGVSCEDQVHADERIPLLLQTPAAKHFVSYEPALGPIRFDRRMFSRISFDCETYYKGLDWVIVGGESGPGARPFDVAWARSTIRQCRESGVACFVKQMGAVSRMDRRDAVQPCAIGGAGWDAEAPGAQYGLVHFRGHGSDPLEWPPDLRVREFPA